MDGRPHGRDVLWAVLVCALTAGSGCRMTELRGPDTYVGPSRTRVEVAAWPSRGGAAGSGTAPTAPPARPAEAPSSDPAGGSPAEAAGPAVSDTSPGVDPAAPGDPASPLRLSVAQAIVMALERNPALAVERLEPKILDTYADEERALFDPLLLAWVGHERVRADDMSSGGDWFRFNTDSLVGEGLLTTLLPTGTTLELEAATWMEDAASDGKQMVQSRVAGTVSQALLRGAGRDVNLARVREARLEALATTYEVRGFAELLVALVEQTYWDLALARRKAEVYQGSIALAERLLEDCRKKIGANALPKSAVAAAEAEVALRRQDLVDARAEAATAEALLFGHMNLPLASRAKREVRLVGELTMPGDPTGPVEDHVRTARRMRPDVNQARLLLRQGEIRLVRTRNGLLPRLDLFATFGQSGFAESFGGSWKGTREDRHDLTVGVLLEHPLGNHAGRARHRRAVLNREQAEQAVANLEQLAETDVRVAHVEAERARAKVSAVADTRRLDQEKLRVETERFRLGQASSFQVARAQRDLTRRQIDESEALAEYHKALVELYRVDGSLLGRRGIEAPGAAPPEDSTSIP